MGSHEIGVFLRCVGADDPAEALALVRDRLGLDLVQLSKLPDEYYTDEGARRVERMLGDAGVRAQSVVIVHDGESYADMAAVRQTVGYVPEETMAPRVEYSRLCVDLAAALGVEIVTTHIGVAPSDESDPVYSRLLEAVGRVGVYGRMHGIMLALETGQESARELVDFMDRLPGIPLGVNFDPGNYAIYDSDDALAAVKLLRERIVGVHVKDGVPPDRPGALGKEARPGEGKARLGECLRYLAETGYEGAYIIENYVARGGTVDEKLGELERAKRFTEEALTL